VHLLHVGFTILASLVIAVHARVSNHRLKAQIKEELVERAIPHKRHLSKAIECTSKLADMVWVFSILKAFRLSDVHFLIKHGLKESIVDVHGVDL
jgi:hypothetical protein